MTAAILWEQQIEPGLHVRPLTAADAEPVYAAVEANREHLRQWLPWLDGMRSAADERAFLSAVEQWHAAGTAMVCGIFVRCGGDGAGGSSANGRGGNSPGDRSVVASALDDLDRGGGAAGVRGDNRAAAAAAVGQVAGAAAAADGEVAGVIGLNSIDRDARHAAIGYWLAERHVGRGIMTRCATGLVEFAFETLRMESIDIRAAVGNLRSRAVPERLRFHRGHLIPEAEWLYDHFVDHVYYSLTASDWRERRRRRMSSSTVDAALPLPPRLRMATSRP